MDKTATETHHLPRPGTSPGVEDKKTMKKKLGGTNLLYPTPTVLAGAMVQGTPNFVTIAHIGILNAAPPHFISLRV